MYRPDLGSDRQKRARRSTFSSEVLALSDTADRGDFMRALFFEMCTGKDARLSEQEGAPMIWCTDSKDAYDSITKQGQSSTAERRMAIEISILKELQQRPLHSIRWVGTEQLLADSLTKDSPKAAQYLRERVLAGTWSMTANSSVSRLMQPLADTISRQHTRSASAFRHGVL